MTTRGAGSRSGSRTVVGTALMAAGLTAAGFMAVGLLTVPASAEPANAWRFWEELEGIIEEQHCHCDGPLENLAMTFQGERLYLVSEVPLAVGEDHVVSVRIDGNPAQDVALRMVNSHLFAVDPGEQLNALIEQFYAGSAYSLSAASLDSFEWSKGSLLGFRSAYESYKRCREAE